MLFGFKPLSKSVFPFKSWLIKHCWKGLIRISQMLFKPPMTTCSIIWVCIDVGFINQQTTFPYHIQDSCSWNGHSTSGPFIIRPNAAQLETSSSVWNSKPSLFCCLYLSLRSLNESDILPTTHLFTSSSKNLLLLAALTLDLFVCISSCFQFFYICTLSLNLGFLSLFKWFYRSSFQKRWCIWGSSFMTSRCRKWFGSANIISGF